MYQEKSLILYRKTPEGRHWLTTLGSPAVQLPPVAANQRRVATFITSVISSKLSGCNHIPDSLYLRAEDAISYGANKQMLGMSGVWIKLGVEKPAIGELDDFYSDESFITPRPMTSWGDSYDDWVFMVAKKLGMTDAPRPADQKSYTAAFEQAVSMVRNKTSKIREIFLQGLTSWGLYLKVGFLNNRQELEYVWLKPLDWHDPKSIRAVIMSDPYDCDDYWLGQELKVPVMSIVDYCISSDG